MNLPGVYAGIVVATNDPQNRRRVRLRIPQVTGTAVSGWASPVSFGFVAPGQQVTVAFEGGDLNYPLYWAQQAVSPWSPLALEPGWVASSSGTPVYRTTADGMVELSGSVETSTAISLGVTVKFASLPAGAWPLETYRAPTATIYRGAYNAKPVLGEYRTTTTTTSTSYVTDPNGPTVTFIAPGTGQAILLWGSLAQNSTAAGRSIMSTRVSIGSTIVADVDDNRSSETQSTANSSTDNSRIVSGLTPGSTYTVTALFRTSDASTTATFDNKWIVVIPVGQHDTPAARVTLTPAGDIQALFPAGAAPAYDVSLTGIRARIL
ncbi:phage baseplate assembly protein V [Streptomyces sp. Midd1]|uniref:phage baseplate assembly protein V n=1 Tax=Streptomyces sp. Midd3 TaxID=3161191 RepID=UPI0034DB357A